MKIKLSEPRLSEWDSRFKLLRVTPRLAPLLAALEAEGVITAAWLFLNSLYITYPGRKVGCHLPAIVSRALRAARCLPLD